MSGLKTIYASRKRPNTYSYHQSKNLSDIEYTRKSRMYIIGIFSYPLTWLSDVTSPLLENVGQINLNELVESKFPIHN